LGFFKIYPDRDDIELPTRGTRHAAAYDLQVFLPDGKSLVLSTPTLLSTGVGLNLTPLFRPEVELVPYALVLPRSSAPHRGYSVQVGLIDADYCRSGNEIRVWVLPHALTLINPGDKIAQLLIYGGHVPDSFNVWGLPNDFFDSDRQGGFGSTGR